MRNLALLLEGLKDELAAVQHEIFILERALSELASVLPPDNIAGADALMHGHVGGIGERLSSAKAKHAVICRLLAEYGHERRRGGAASPGSEGAVLNPPVVHSVGVAVADDAHQFADRLFRVAPDE